jgi:RNA 3'-terminal phosphate cyclase (ATP)
MLEIDGSQGEGGGQVLRTSLSLSALTGRSFHLTNIRGKRSKPGLRPQHITAVRAVAAICEAEITGDTVDSHTLTFAPQAKPKGGDYTFDVTEAAQGRSAGSVTLILQAMLWPLLFADAPSHIILRGGTFVPFSPPYHYIAEVAHPAFARLGATFSTKLNAWVWNSSGGGEIEADIQPIDGLEAVEEWAVELDDWRVVGGVAAVTNLRAHIARRMVKQAEKLLQQDGLTTDIATIRERGRGPGSGLCLWITQAGFSHLGRKGLAPQQVAETAVTELLDFMENGADVDSYLADQLLLPLALAAGPSQFTTDVLTSHVVTNADLLRQWLGVEIEIKGKIGETAEIIIEGIGLMRE